MKTADKNRLVGALVLAALAAILLPLLFGDPQDPTTSIRSSFDGEPLRVTSPPVEPEPVVAVRLDAAPAAPEPAPAREPAKAKPTTSAEKPAAAQAPPRSAAPEPDSSSPAPAPESGWILQLASFSQKPNAHRLLERVRDKGHRAYIEQVTVGGKRLYRVRVGPVAGEQAARQLQGKLEKEHDLRIRLYPPA